MGLVALAAITAALAAYYYYTQGVHDCCKNRCKKTEYFKKKKKMQNFSWYLLVNIWDLSNKQCVKYVKKVQNNEKKPYFHISNSGNMRTTLGKTNTITETRGINYTQNF